jgi:hypothetical protein
MADRLVEWKVDLTDFPTAAARAGTTAAARERWLAECLADEKVDEKASSTVGCLVASSAVWKDVYLVASSEIG